MQGAKPHNPPAQGQQNGAQHDHTSASENRQGQAFSQKQNRQASRDKRIQIIDGGRHGGTDFLNAPEP